MLTEIERFRLSPEDRERLEELAKRSKRTKSQVLRLLLAQAQINQAPDVTLSTESMRAEGEARR